MSAITSDDETDFSCGGDGEETRISKKVAIFMAFCGVGYKGMQRNKGAKTIEGELEEALFHAGAVSESNRGEPKQYDFARSARTDKGVSAVGQVVSGRFYIDPPGFVDRLNSNLPDQIRVLGYRCVTESFSSKKFCDGRRYVYLLPVFALDSMSHRDREAVMASLGSGEEYVKCLECSERGRKIPNAVGNWKGPGFVAKSLNVRSNTSSALGLSSGKVKVAEIQESVCRLNTKQSVEKNNEMASEALSSVASVQEDVCISDMDLPEEPVVKMNEEVKRKLCYGEKEKERFNRILSYYVGSHNFHNFTTRMEADDPAANRHIISFTANTVINIDGIEFIKCEVVGKSFMLHQIRKMMGLAVAVVRNCAPESLIQTAFSKDVNITVPMAPEHGLYLDECFFTSYNQKLEDSHEQVSIEAYREEAEAFKLKHIYSHIGSVERKYGNMALWLHSLNYRNYPDLNYNSNRHNTDQVKVNVTQDTTEPK